MLCLVSRQDTDDEQGNGILKGSKQAKNGRIHCEPAQDHNDENEHADCYEFDIDRLSNLFDGFAKDERNILESFLKQECLARLPPTNDLDILCSIYLEDVQPILPVVEKASYLQLNNTDPSCVLLQQAMCLVASMNPRARKHLRLKTGEVRIQSSPEVYSRQCGSL